jgi:type VII secretion-associated protein (TIGR03931 family)
MTDVIVEVGPGTVRGSNDVREEWVSAAIECVDDEIALIDDRPVLVADVWRDVLASAVGGFAETVVLVCPTWWPSARIDLVCDAARSVANDVQVLQRTAVLRDGLADRLWTVVEIAAEFLVLTGPEGDSTLVTRRDDRALAEFVAAQLGPSAAVLVDAPAGIAGAAVIGATVADHLRASGMTVLVADEDGVHRAAATWLARQRDPGTPDVRPPIRRRRRGMAVAAGAAMCVSALCGGFAMRDDKSEPAVPMTLLVEGRVGVKVPVQWSVQRVTTGPGSARVQVVSPSDADIVVHITQSSVPAHQTLPMVADTLRSALAEEPSGVFTDFNPADRRADRPAVTYREMRANHEVAWTVLTDDGVRIAIGCQSGRHREHLVREACDQAIQSAHAVLSNSAIGWNRTRRDHV